MNNRGQWNIGVGVALLLGGVFLMNRGGDFDIILGIVLAGFGAYFAFK